MSSDIIIGGKGYRWKGRSLKFVQLCNFPCISLSKKDSIIMAQCLVKMAEPHKITITAAKGNGNGIILVNFFGGINYDGAQIPVEISSNDLREYTIEVPAPNAPDNVSIYFRIWRPVGATGNVTIKQICITSAEESKQNLVKWPVKSGLSASSKKLGGGKKRNNIRKPFNNYGEAEKNYDEQRKIKDENEILKKAKNLPKISIITPTRDNLKFLKRCYEALVANTYYPNWEWIIGDSASVDKTVEYIRGLNDSRIILLERGTTEGSFATINNDLVDLSNGDLLCFLNDDVEPQPFWLYRMASKLYSNAQIGIVGAKLLYPDHTIQHAGIVFSSAGPDSLKESSLKLFPSGFADYDRYYQAVIGACLLIRRKDFEDVERFDPAYYFSQDDIDLCLKVKFQLNKKVLYAANAILIHHHNVSLKKFKTLEHKKCKEGNNIFIERWMKKVELDFEKFRHDIDKGKTNIEVAIENFSRENTTNIVIADKLPIVIWAPRFDIGSGGCLVLHKLCHMLREKGENAYLWIAGGLSSGATNPRFNTPLANGIIDTKNSVVIYPETVSDDPLCGKVIVRWILYTIGFHASFFVPALSDILVYYAPRFVQNPDPANQLCIFDLQEEQFTFNGETPKRSGGCYIVRKGKNKPRTLETSGYMELCSTNPEYTIPILRSKEIFYSYDSTTTTSLHAAMCGCLSVVAPDDGISAEEYRKTMPMHKYGIAYGTSKEEIDYAKKTQHLVKDYLKDIEKEGYNQINMLLLRLESLRTIQ